MTGDSGEEQRLVIRLSGTGTVFDGLEVHVPGATAADYLAAAMAAEAEGPDGETVARFLAAFEVAAATAFAWTGKDETALVALLDQHAPPPTPARPEDQLRAAIRRLRAAPGPVVRALREARHTPRPDQQ